MSSKALAINQEVTQAYPANSTLVSIWPKAMTSAAACWPRKATYRRP